MIKTITLKWLQSKREDMNTQNFARLEACKRLVEAGIVLETDFYWVKLITRDEWVLSTLDNVVLKFYESIPAPSMAEVWRELPEWTECKKQAVETKCVLMTKDNIKVFFSENPTDALIDLLIYIKDLKRSD